MKEHAPLRVVQWTSGNIAHQTVRAVLARDDLELVGLFAYSGEKVGVDVGELCNLGRSVGVTATDDIGALLALGPDCVVYTPLHPDTEHLTRLLSAGVNVVTTSEILTGRTLDVDARASIEDACATGGATLLGTGMNPGWVQLLAGVAAGISLGVRQVRVTESVDVSLFAGDANFDRFGWVDRAHDPVMLPTSERHPDLLRRSRGPRPHPRHRLPRAALRRHLRPRPVRPRPARASRGSGHRRRHRHRLGGSRGRRRRGPAPLTLHPHD